MGISNTADPLTPLGFPFWSPIMAATMEIRIPEATVLVPCAHALPTYCKTRRDTADRL
jgi:hypothetical protein